MTLGGPVKWTIAGEASSAAAAAGVNRGGWWGAVGLVRSVRYVPMPCMVGEGWEEGWG